jgi:predicted glycoside hydrolase/deacetylase ChbG (UPF0249 family)
MVTGRAVAEAVSISRDHPRLDIGLHWDIWGEEDELGFDINDLSAVCDEFCRQMDTFYGLLGRMPTHIDSHRHVHLRQTLLPVFRELVEPLGVPLRYDGRVRCVGSFYAQWEWMVTNLEYVSVPFLQRMLHEEVNEGWTEFLCHPGYVSPNFTSVYLVERETEVRTLTDSRIRYTTEQLGICLVSYADYLKAVPGTNA